MEFPGSLEVTAMAQVRSLAQGLPRVKSLAKKKKGKKERSPAHSTNGWLFHCRWRECGNLLPGPAFPTCLD